MTYVMILVLYALDASVFAYKNLTEVDLYDGNVYHNIILVCRSIVLVYLLARITFLRRRPEKRLMATQERGFLLLYGLVLGVTLAGYLTHDFIFRYVFRDCVTNLFTVAAIHALVVEHHHDPLAGVHMLRLFRGLLAFHVVGIVILTVVKFDLAFVADKIIFHPLERRTYEEGRLYFFAMAGNEEAYTILIYALVGSIGWRLWVKSLFLVASVAFFVYLGTRTVFFLSLLILIVWPLLVFKSRELRLFVVLVLAFGVAMFWERMYQVVIVAFDFLPAAGGGIDLSALVQEDTLGWRVMFVWVQIWEELTHGVNAIVGISVNGLSELSKSGEEQLTAVHNAFLYYLAVSGIVGVALYIKGYRVMIRSWIDRKRREGPDMSDASVSFLLSIIVMITYALMNNAYSLQGMLTYAFLVVFALVREPDPTTGLVAGSSAQGTVPGELRADH